MPPSDPVRNTDRFEPCHPPCFIENQWEKTTLSETNRSHLRMNGWNTRFLLGLGLLSGEMVFFVIKLQPDLLDVWTETQDANQWQMRLVSRITEAKHVGLGGEWTMNPKYSSSSIISSAAAETQKNATLFHSAHTHLENIRKVTCFFGTWKTLFF